MEEQKATGSSRGVADVWGSFLFFEPLIEYSLSTEIFLIDKWAVLLSFLTLGEELLPRSKEKLSFTVYLSHENVSLNTFCDAIIQAWSRTTKQALFWEWCIFTTGGRKEKDYGGKKIRFYVSSNNFSRYAYASAIYLDCFTSSFLFNQVSNFTYERAKESKR